MKQKKWWILLGCGLVISAALLICWFAFRNSLKPKTYTTAKEECIQYLSAHRTQMEEIAQRVIQEGEGTSGYYQNRYYNYRPKDGFVSFDINGQGMLGGQYWELVYTPNGKYYNKTEVYLHRETDGNNIVRGERLDEHWWYLWVDYDGTARSEL